MDKNHDCISQQPNIKSKNQINDNWEQLMKDIKDPKSPINVKIQNNQENNRINNENIWNGIYTLAKLIGFPIENFEVVCKGKKQFEEVFPDLVIPIKRNGGLKKKLLCHSINIQEKLNNHQKEFELYKKKQSSSVEKTYNKQLTFNKEINEEISSLNRKNFESHEQISVLKEEINLLKEEIRNKFINSDKSLDKDKNSEVSAEKKTLLKDQNSDKYLLKNKQGNTLYPKISVLIPDKNLTSKITGMLIDLDIFQEAQIRFMIDSEVELKSRINECLEILKEEDPELDIKPYFLKILNYEKINIQKRLKKTKDYSELKHFIYSNFKHYDEYKMNYLISNQAEEFFSEIFNVFEKDKIADNYDDLIYIMNQNNENENQFTAENIYQVISKYVLDENTNALNIENSESIKIFKKIDYLEETQNEKFDRLKQHFKTEYENSINTLKFEIKWLKESVNVQDEKLEVQQEEILNYESLFYDFENFKSNFLKKEQDIKELSELIDKQKIEITELKSTNLNLKNDFNELNINSKLTKTSKNN